MFFIHKGRIRGSVTVKRASESLSRQSFLQLLYIKQEMISKSKTEVTLSASAREKPGYSSTLIIALEESLHFGGGNG